MALLRRCLILCAVLVLPLFGSAAPHPFFDDGGAIPWRISFTLAKQQALATGKPIILVANGPKSTGCKKLVTETLKDAKVASLLRRHFIPVVVDLNKSASDTLPYFKAEKVGGSVLPLIAMLNDRAQFMRGTSDEQEPAALLTELMKVLEDKSFAIPKATEASLGKQVEALQKALDAKNYKVATTTFYNILKVRGYSPNKDKAYELMEEAQFDGTRAFVEVVLLADMEDYAEAKKLLAPVVKDFAGLPVAAEAKDHEAILKSLETVKQLAKDKKGNWKQAALTQISTLQSKYPDSAYTNVINKKKKEIE